MMTKELIKRVPKVELHDHLDGGLRPQTIIELADTCGVALPSHDPVELSTWFARGCVQKSLPLYLETFAVTVAVMQTPEALRRIAIEAMEDLAADHVVYAEIRFAPILHTMKGLSMDEVVVAVLEGMDEGKRRTGMSYGVILCSMRNQDPAL